MRKDEIILEIYPEIYCEYCNEIIHNHIDCPECKNTYAGTDIYFGIQEEAQIGFELECDCGTIYKIIDSEYPYKWKIKNYEKDKN